MLDDDKAVPDEILIEEDVVDAHEPINLKDEEDPYDESDKEGEGDYSLSFMSGMDPYEEFSEV